MQLQRFVEWCETVGSRRRVEGFAILAGEFLDRRLGMIDGAVLESALLLGLDDPSPGVRSAMAEAFATHASAPRAIVRALLFDEPAIAVRVAASPVLTDDDLLDALSHAAPSLRSAIAARDPLPPKLVRRLAEDAAPEVCGALLANGDAQIDAGILRRLADRHGGDAGIRGALLSRRDLPPDVRQTLIVETGRSLRHSPFVAAVLGAEGAARTVFDSCERATSRMAEEVETADVPNLVGHLLRSGQISAAFLVRSACAGHIDLLAAALAALSGLPERRVRAIIVEGREAPFLSLVGRCGLPPSVAALLRIVIRLWKDIATGGSERADDDVSDLVMRRALRSFRVDDADPDAQAVATLVRRLAAETAQDAMRRRMRRMMAA